MPNWCSNRLEVTGEPDQIQAFLSACRRGEEALSFEALRPTPTDLEGKVEGQDPQQFLAESSGVTEATNSHTWRLSHWGTKWDAEGTRFEETGDEGRIVMIFDTAWSAAAPIVRFMIATWPTLRFDLLWVDYANEEAGRVFGVDGTDEVDEPAEGEEADWLERNGLDPWDVDED